MAIHGTFEHEWSPTDPNAAEQLQQHNEAAARERVALEESMRQQYLQQPTDPTDSLSLAEIRALAEKSEAAENARNNQNLQYACARQFCADHVEYCQTPRNAERIARYLEASGLDGSDVSHYDQAYAALAQRGLVQVDRSKIPVRPRTQLSEQDLYDMPMERLRELGNR